MPGRLAALAARSNRVAGGPHLHPAAARLLRWVLPLCLLAAAAVAGQGLYRVVGTPAAAVTTGAPSLSLGSGSGAGTASLPPRTPAPSPATSQGTTRTGPPEPVTKPVVVINASNVTGLAGRTATLLRQRGVSVAAIGNLAAAQRPAIRTVYYPPGGRGQARTLAALTGASAVAPAPQWLGAHGRLVLVVTGATLVRS